MFMEKCSRWESKSLHYKVFSYATLLKILPTEPPPPEQPPEVGTNLVLLNGIPCRLLHFLIPCRILR